jgi:hypothetical protein
MTSIESGSSEISLLKTALDAIKERHQVAREAADSTARQLGYDLAKNPRGDYRDRIETLRIEDAVANAIIEDVRTLGGYATGLYIAPSA